MATNSTYPLAKIDKGNDRTNNNTNTNTKTTNDLTVDVDADADPPKTPPTFKLGWRFWLIYVSLCLTTFAAAVDNTIVFTALLAITRTIYGEGDYVWIANAYVVASTAVQPLFGRMSNLWEIVAKGLAKTLTHLWISEMAFLGNA
ncbi:hypothetical protein F5Y02DRAFT_32215 [Annulohypoxylon stygium]|nr:hypothetical protein F5Y02DRAFT_32215 [Annulohypoxylon stygium]